MKFLHGMLNTVSGSRQRSATLSSSSSSRTLRFNISSGTMLSTLLMSVVFVDFAVRSSTGVRWLSIASAGTAGGQVERIRVEDECEKLQGLVKKQKVICKKNVDMMDAVKSGAVIAIQECQQQFASRRWNCSTVNAVTIFGKIHNSGIREMAFVHAISSAGVAHAVTKACSSGLLDRCGCDKTVGDRMTTVPSSSTSSSTISMAVTASGSGISSSTQSQYVGGSVETNHLPRSGAWLTSGAGGGPTGGTGSSHAFEWAGCSDNVAYGSAFAKLFVDAKEKARGRDAARALMNLHNNNAGRRAVEDAMRIQCKCHGVSGSCEVKTCWRSLAPFRDVGNILKDKYNGATEVEQKVVGGTRRELVPTNDDFKPPTDADLVYLDQSPDFCEYDQRTGSLGTRGRTCNKTSKAIDGCELMCCGRGYQEIRRNIVERCKCKFHWCCYVQCKRCSRTVTEYVCR